MTRCPHLVCIYLSDVESIGHQAQQAADAPQLCMGAASQVCCDEDHERLNHAHSSRMTYFLKTISPTALTYQASRMGLTKDLVMCAGCHTLTLST